MRDRDRKQERASASSLSPFRNRESEKESSSIPIFFLPLRPPLVMALGSHGGYRVSKIHHRKKTKKTEDKGDFVWDSLLPRGPVFLLA